MIIDFRRTDAPGEYDADICIIGSGAAGLTLAAHLAGPLRVLIVEAGDAAVVEGRDDFLRGEAAQLPVPGLEGGRVRAFGGATRRWAGQLIRLDPIDFARRDWVAHSGWPITHEQLVPYYDKAERFLGVGGTAYDASLWRRSGIPAPDFAGDDVTPKFTVYMPEPDFTKAFGARLVRQNAAVDILLNAAVVRIELDGNAHRVTGLRLRGAGGRDGLVRARAVVLCGGGIENPRLLLASNDVMACGIGNGRDLVGRFFQDHPNGLSGSVATTRPRALQHQFRKLRHGRVLAWPKLALTEAAQRRERTLNANMHMVYNYANDSPLVRSKHLIAAARSRHPLAIAREGLRTLPHLPELARQGAHTILTGKAVLFTASRAMPLTFVEQVPDPDNRVTLSAERDAYGIPRVRLAWRIHADELRTMRVMTEALGRCFRRLGFGDMTPEPWLDQGVDAASGHVGDFFHHAGTTRMADTPENGVTNPDCLVFGTDNLYIAGSSLFPTSGYANPTLTIVALAIRLSEKLQALGR
jgi:choline dehydrogenase-like flavoprotein